MDPSPMLVAVLVAALLGAVVVLALPAAVSAPPPRADRRARSAPGSGPGSDPGSDPVDERGWLVRGRLLWSLLAGLGALGFVGGPAGVVAAVPVAVVVWTVCARAEPPARRRAREAARRELPHLVGLLGDGLRAGQPASGALALAVAALPGPAADRVARVLPRLALGVDAGVVWAELAEDRDLGPLGRSLARAHTTGAPAGTAIDRLAVELARSARSDVEDRARAVGVRAAVPLTLCLLPSFVLLGIVPVVAGLLASLGV